MQEPTDLSRLVPYIVLAILVVVLGGGWLLFPRIQAWMAYQDCVAVGRTACGG